MEVNLSRQGEVEVVALNGRFDAQSASDADKALAGLLDGTSRNILIDMEGVEYISSAGLRVLLASAKKSGATGGKLVLSGLRPYVREVFEVAGFSTIFNIQPDQAAALASF